MKFSKAVVSHVVLGTLTLQKTVKAWNTIKSRGSAAVKVGTVTGLASSEDGDGPIVGFVTGSAVSASDSGIIPPQFPVVYDKDNSKVAIKTRGGAPGHAVPRGRRLSLSWNQVGEIDGNWSSDVRGDHFGSSVVMSADGTRFVASALGYGGMTPGLVRVYERSGTVDWVQVGGDIVPRVPDGGHDHFGIDVAMTPDGTRIAIGADYAGSSTGYVKVYEWNGTGDWAQVGNTLRGETTNQRFGTSVAISADGTRLAIGAPWHDSHRGHVRVYHQPNEGGNFVQLGNDVDGESTWNDSGGAVAMSADGTRLAIGAIVGNGSRSGHVRMFEWDNSHWVQMGNTINGPAGDGFGHSVTMSTDGTRVAIGAMSNYRSANKAGYVQVYQRDGASWRQLGNTIYGLGEENFGRQISMTANGTRLAIAGPNHRENGALVGRVMVFEWSSSDLIGDWIQLANDIYGEAAGDSFENVAMSADGTRIAVGAPSNDMGMDDYRQSGHVRVWDLVSPTASPTSAPTSAGPWDVKFIDVDADFSANSEVAFEYEVGVGHAFRSELLLKGCEVHVNDSLYNSSDDIQPINDTYQNLTRTYDFKMTEVAQSNVWNASTNKLAVCQKLHLWLPDPDGDPTTADAMDISTDVREIEIEFDLEANFDTIVNLAPGTTENVNQTVNFQTAVRGYKCNGGDTNPFDDYVTELAPNEELAICVVSTDASVEIDELVNMNSQQGATIVPIVTGGVANIAGITSKVKLDDGPTTNGIVVKTFLPLNKFTFAVNEEVTISGSVTMRLIGRRLQVDRKLRTLAGEDFSTDDGPKEAAYQVKVELKGADSVVQGDGVPLGSSAGHATSKYAAALGLISIVTANFM